MPRSPLRVVCLFALAAAACNGESKPPPPTTPTAPTKGEEATGPEFFAEVTGESGIRHTYRNGEEAEHLSILESLGGGVALLDFDGDGLLDVFLTGGGAFTGPDKKTITGLPNRLYRNLGGFRFEDVTAKVGLDKLLFYDHGAAVADFDRDGRPDLLVTGWGRLALLRNVDGLRFDDVTETAGLTNPSWSSSAAWGDLDGDGWPDLYVCHYADWSFVKNHPTDCTYDGKTRDVCAPKRFQALPHKLFRNNANGTFADVSAAAGLRPGGNKEGGKGLGVVIADVNNDGRPDIYVANDTDNNFLYMNRTGSDGKLKLEERGLPAGVAVDDRAVPDGSMGVDAGDFNHSGLASIWVTNYENELHMLYRNSPPAGAKVPPPGRELFLAVTTSVGIAALGRNHVGWGTGFLDLDHHGWEDLVAFHGHAIRFPTGAAGRKELPALMRNEKARFSDLTPRGGPYFREPHNARGAALGDLDNDGRIDAVVCHLNEPAAVLKNVADTQGRHWLGVELRGKKHRDLAGARVVVETEDGIRRTRFFKGGGSYASSGDRRLLFGLGEARGVKRLEVSWPGRDMQTIEKADLDKYLRLDEPE
jgi:hypothetical protein